MTSASASAPPTAIHDLYTSFSQRRSRRFFSIRFAFFFHPLISHQRSARKGQFSPSPTPTTPAKHTKRKTEARACSIVDVTTAHSKIPASRLGRHGAKEHIIPYHYRFLLENALKREKGKGNPDSGGILSYRIISIRHRGKRVRCAVSRRFERAREKDRAIGEGFRVFGIETEKRGSSLRAV